eukprot:1157726-Pelagomonas_calceolata.AAC.12
MGGVCSPGAGGTGYRTEGGLAKKGYRKGQGCLAVPASEVSLAGAKQVPVTRAVQSEEQEETI